jgi:hypothetical protein
MHVTYVAAWSLRLDSFSQLNSEISEIHKHRTSDWAVVSVKDYMTVSIVQIFYGVHFSSTVEFS